MSKIFDLKVSIQPVHIEYIYPWNPKDAPVAYTAWVKGPLKPREIIQRQEEPPKDVSLESLQKSGFIEVLDKIVIRDPEDTKNISSEADALIVSNDYFADYSITDAIASLGKPILSPWDRWGYSIGGRVSKFSFKRYSKVKRFIPMGEKDIFSILGGLIAWKSVKNLRILYIGDFPSHSVTLGDRVDFNYLNSRFGTETIQIGFDEYIQTINSLSENDVKDIVNSWLESFVFLDETDKKVVRYAKIYKSLKMLLEKYDANAITVDCAALPGLEYVPCLAYSILINEGVPCGCEADIPALYAMTILMSISKKPVLMGNLNANVTHADIERNNIVVNHDIVPPYFACNNCKYNVRDYHETGKGATPYTDLINGMDVTLAGLSWDLDMLWSTKGKVIWTMDTVHCRISIGIHVENAKRVSREAKGHHVSLVYGDYVSELEKAAELLDLEFKKL